MRRMITARGQRKCSRLSADYNLHPMSRGGLRGWAIVAALSGGSALSGAVSFTDGVQVAMLPVFLDEASGLAQSRTNPGVFWVHNDSGDEPRVYAVSRSGALLGSYTLSGATAIDWEEHGDRTGGRRAKLSVPR